MCYQAYTSMTGIRPRMPFNPFHSSRTDRAIYSLTKNVKSERHNLKRKNYMLCKVHTLFMSVFLMW